MVIRTQPSITHDASGAAPRFDGILAPWDRRTRAGHATRRARARGLAAQLPLLLAPELSEVDWAFHRLWDLRRATDFIPNLAGPALAVLARRVNRILATSDLCFLDDGLYAPDFSPGIIVVDASRQEPLDELLVTIAGLLGGVRALYRQVKVHGAANGELYIAAAEGRHRRVIRRFETDADGLVRLRDIAEVH